MWKRVLVSNITVLPLLAGVPAFAAESSQMAASDTALTHPKCIIAQAAVEANPAVEGDRIIGRVYSIVGDDVWVELKNGERRRVGIGGISRAVMGNMFYDPVVITDFYCERINRYYPPFTVVQPKAVVVEPTPAPPPPAPRPVAPPTPPAPVEQPAPVIVPQTW
ncbi:MAG: hypothetical protein ACKO24_05280 [Leptolyngbyaceae cyanobacterium]